MKVEDITAEQVLEKMNQVTEEWVNNDLEKGVVLGFRYLKGGNLKMSLLYALWINKAVPIVFGLIILFMVMNKEWVLFWSLFGAFVLYLIVGAVFRIRERGNFILKTDGITMVLNHKKIFVPWEAVHNIDYYCAGMHQAFENAESYSELNSSKKPGAYRLIIKTMTEKYEFCEIYAKTLIVDANGQVNPAVMSLHVAYKLLVNAKSKVNM